ncbi:TIGR04182 family glycosyltransferase [Halobacteriales archaeon SW_7_65_23]|nr:MAG: TIGR04182 family glycosyltransferase [Halobacteriales archaeon SW_7_65_23]
MGEYDVVCVLIPTYNEAATISEVVERFRAEGFERILVIDGGSTDGTQELAREAGADVVQQSGDGKGQAVREGVGLIEEPYVLLVDGDSTYRPEEAGRLLEPLLSGEVEHVIGDRFADMQPGAMTRLNKVGNRVINRAFAFIHGRDLQDILSGYRAFTRRSFERLTLSADGFGIETEMSVECVKHDVETAVVPITYEPRPEESETNLRPFRDGGNIIVRLYQMARTNNPIFYFGSVGVVSAITGVFLAGFVAYRYFVRGISHEVIALASGVALLFGLQLVMFGVLSDLIVTANRRQGRRIDRIDERLEAIESASVGGAMGSASIDGSDAREQRSGERESDRREAVETAPGGSREGAPSDDGRRGAKGDDGDTESGYSGD